MEPGARHTVNKSPATQRLPEVYGQGDCGAAHTSRPDRAGDPGNQHLVLALMHNKATTARDDDDDRPSVRGHRGPGIKRRAGGARPRVQRDRFRSGASSSGRRCAARCSAATHHEQHRDHAWRGKRCEWADWAHVDPTRHIGGRFRVTPEPSSLAAIDGAVRACAWECATRSRSSSRTATHRTAFVISTRPWGVDDVAEEGFLASSDTFSEAMPRS
jgi:hypothetical protein